MVPLCKRKGRAASLETPARLSKPRPGGVAATVSRPLEVELDRKLDDAMALLLGYRSEQRRVDLAGSPIETKIQVAAVERPQRVIQEVGSIEPDLQLLRFLELEVLEESQIGVEEGRSVNRGKDCGAILADGGRDAETVR